MSGERPGGWVEGIGWVALVRTLDLGDEFKFNEGDQPTDVDDYWLQNDANSPVIVTRWADGTTPAPPNPDTDGGRWIVDGGDGCTTEFDTEAEAVAYADACIQDWCDEGWMEEVDNIFVARLTHRSQRQVVAVQGEVSDEEWERVTHGGSGFSEWWDYTIEPLAATPAPVTPPTECVGHVDVNLPHDWCDRCGSFLRATPPETVPVPRECGASSGPFLCTLPAGHEGVHVEQAVYASWPAAARVPGDLRPEDAYERSAQRRAVDPSRRSSAT